MNRLVNVKLSFASAPSNPPAPADGRVYAGYDMETGRHFVREPFMNVYVPGVVFRTKVHNFTA